MPDRKYPAEKFIHPPELQRRLAGGSPAQLLDVRTPAEYAVAHVPGAKLVPLDDLDAATFGRERGNDGTPVYVLCQSGGRARRALEKLERAGVPGCVLVEGGTQAWIDAGLPVNRGESRVLPLMQQMQIVVGFISAVGAALALLVNPWFAVIPLAMGCGLFFAGLTGICGLALLLAKMPWNKSPRCNSTSWCTAGSIALKSLCLPFALLFLAAPSLQAATTITFLEYKDLHAHLVPHLDLVRAPGSACPDENDNFEAATAGQLDASTIIGVRGGVARLATLLNQIRATSTNVVAMNIGDAYHGGAEAFYTSGEAIIDPVNALGFDVGVPGNWDYAYGPYVSRKRYNPTGAPTGALPYQQVKPSNTISKQPNFPQLAANVTLAKLGPSDPTVNGAAFLPATITLTRGGVKIGFIGISSDIVSQMYQPLALGFTFLQGQANYVNLVNTQRAALRAAGCQIVVVMSELGLQKNHALAQLIAPGVDVIFSAHTHELTRVPLTSASGALVVEAGNDCWLGRMDIIVDNGVITNRVWSVLPITPDLAEDATVKALVDIARAPFLVANPNLTDPSASGSGQKLTQPITNSVGQTAGTLTRLDALESSFNNVFTDHLRAKTGKQLALTPGFRFDSVAPGTGVPLEDNTVSSGAVTWEDVYRFFPVVYTHATAEVSGQRLHDIVESSLTAVFSPGAWNQGGGWVDGFSGLHATINLRAPDGARVSSLHLGDANGPVIQSNQVLTVAGCQRPTEAADILCSYSGFTTKVSYVNPATSLSWTVVDMFSDLLAQGPIAASTRHDLADTSGLPRWPVMPFVQPLNDDTDGDGLSDEWERHYFGNLNATVTNSASGDGIANLFKYALHLNPAVPGTMGLPKFALTNGTANYNYCRARPELGYAVESSTNLFLWTTNGVNQGQGTNVPTTATVSVSATPLKFFRLRVNAN